MTARSESSARVEPEPRARPYRVPPERLLQDWKEARERALAYLATLDVPEADCEALAFEAVERALNAEGWRPGADALGETLDALRALLLERYPSDAPSWCKAIDEFLAWRVQSTLTGRDAAPPPIGPFGSMPKLARRSMVPLKLERRWIRPRQPLDDPRRDKVLGKRRGVPWTRVARRRRLLLLVLVFIPSVIASGFMLNVLPHQGRTWVEFGIVLFFGALFGWISIGFWTALLGFFTLVGRRDRFAVTRLEGADGEIAPEARTAIVMPICQEPVDRVFAGLRAIYHSVERTGKLAHFDFFVLSDSADPGTWVKEEAAWAAWCRDVGGFGRIFYRRRRVRLKRKSGNVADFCRRWGKLYRYMIMLDADSVMSGDTIVRLVQMMERHPGAAMIQTAPSAVNRRSLFARVQQFSSRVYGPMFAAGLHYWQLGDGQYWGHNTVIRVEPFTDNCGLAPLPGKPPLGGEILSHDFVEAALLGRAGWSLWLAYDLPGSWEETPSTMLEEMQRDRRWCQGNLQHLRLLPTEGLFGAHRALFLNGVLSYVSALLWFCFLTLSTAEAIINALHTPDYFPHGPSLFPEWPVWHPNWAIWLMVVTGLILFLPKVLSVLLIAFTRRAPLYGGLFKLGLSVFIEILLSSLFAPIRMVFHSRFVVQNVLGRTVAWGSQNREDAQTGWGEAIRRHGVDTVVATAWAVSLYLLNPHYFWWVTPIIVALVVSVPLSVYTSRVSLGDRTRARKLFLIPEESDPPPELRDLEAELARAQAARAHIPESEKDGFVRAAVDPFANALHVALLRGPRALGAAIRARRQAMLDRALTDGPGALDAKERKVLLYDAAAALELHERVWDVPEQIRAARWGRPGHTGG